MAGQQQQLRNHRREHRRERLREAQRQAFAAVRLALERLVEWAHEEKAQFVQRVIGRNAQELERGRKAQESTSCATAPSGTEAQDAPLREKNRVVPCPVLSRQAGGRLWQAWVPEFAHARPARPARPRAKAVMAKAVMARILAHVQLALATSRSQAQGHHRVPAAMLRATAMIPRVHRRPHVLHQLQS